MKANIKNLLLIFALIAANFIQAAEQPRSVNALRDEYEAAIKLLNKNAIPHAIFLFNEIIKEPVTDVNKEVITFAKNQLGTLYFTDGFKNYKLSVDLLESIQLEEDDNGFTNANKIRILKMLGIMYYKGDEYHDFEKNYGKAHHFLTLAIESSDINDQEKIKLQQILDIIKPVTCCTLQ